MLKLFVVLIAGLVIQINGENLPVFLWGQKTPTYLPTLQHLGGEEFVTLIKSQATEDTKTVVFIENNLSVEDFSQCRLKTKTCFENLQRIEEKTFLNSVEDPVESLIASYNKKKSISVSSEADLKDVDAQDEKILLVYLDDVENPEDFDKHDELMSKIFKELQAKYGNVVAIYTGRHPSFKYSKSLVRKARDAAEEKVVEKTEEKPAPVSETPVVAPKPKQNEIGNEPRYPWQHVPYLLNSDPHLLLAINSIWIGENNVTENAPPTVTVTIPDEFNMTVTLIAGTNNIIMKVINSTGRWEIETFTFENEIYYPKNHVYGFSAEWSFGCSNLTIESAAPRENVPRKYIHLVGFRFQPSWSPMVVKEGDTVVKFGPCNDCVGFFSPAIWGALFVVFLLLLIMSWGLSNMMEIRTMDRFDDPKGKTIIINAQD